MGVCEGDQSHVAKGSASKKGPNRELNPGPLPSSGLP